MDKTTPVNRQVQLLVRTLPFVAKERCFALKGGTAINLFVRDLPRLSVDIDLTYLSLENRETSFKNIRLALDRITKGIQSAISGIRICSTNPNQTDSLNVTVRNREGSQIKIEVSPVLRGTVFPPTEMETVNVVQDEFGFAEIQVVSFHDLYAGKICAALDRQHPRDLFDIHLLFENEGIDRNLIRTFLVYLISHNRPMAELLSPSLKDIRHPFEHEFREMTREEVTLEKLEGVRLQLIDLIHNALTDDDREFLLSIKRKKPNWSLLGMDRVEELPAVRWKLKNLERMDADKHAKALKRLESVLGKKRLSKMIQFQPPDTLRQHRPMLLALEAIGWLHMAGKANAKFLQRPEKSNFKKWHSELNDPLEQIFDWLDKYLQNAYSKWKLSGSPPTLKNLIKSMFEDFAEYESKKNLVSLLQAGHAMASGIEKNLPSSTSGYLGQDVTHMWLSTAFGYPVRNLLTDPPELLTETGWKQLLQQIEKLLKELKKLGDPTSPHKTNDLDGWWRWREDAIGEEGWLRKAFTSTLAETRLPNNDVTLFDQSYVAAALFKSAAAGAILEGNQFPWSDNNLKQNTRWRLLTIGIGADHYEARAVKIGDWTGARLALDEFFMKVRNLVEVDLAVGSLLYRDGEVCVFSFPGERTNKEIENNILQVNRWKDKLQKQIDKFASEANFETPPYCKISEKPSRSLVGMTKEIQKARKVMSVPIHRDGNINLSTSANGHVCPVCLMRKNENNTDKQEPCEICKGRRTHRRHQWLSGDLGSDTIWISELADSNDRVALVTMSLDIEHWLDGSRLDSLRAQAIAEWYNNNKKVAKSVDNQIKKYSHHPVGKRLDFYLKKRIDNPPKDLESDGIIPKIIPGFKDEVRNTTKPLDSFKDLFVKIVSDRVDTIEWYTNNNLQNAKWFVFQSFRKLASPGRIYRFQRQGEEFFKTLLSEFRELASENPNRWRTRRLILKPSSNATGNWKEGQPYNGVFNNKPLDLLYSKNKGGFITITNLSRLLEKTDGKDSLKDKTISLKDDNNKKADDLEIKSVEEISDSLNVYHPVIPLEVSPVQFRVLLPLECASACVDRAVAAWNEQFARVWDRLPLRIGMVAFPRMTPFQAVIEAARNLEHDLDAAKQENLQVARCETRDGITVLNLKSLDGSHELLRTMPIRLRDGRDDVFYPYLEVEDSQVRFPLDFLHPNGQVYRHVRDLHCGDGVHVYPARILTTFLDDTARRFEVKTSRQILEWQRMRTLWSLLEQHAPSQTALRGAWTELTQKRGDWQSPNGTWLEGGESAWLELVRAVFHERLQVKGACLETLVEAARDCLLDWCLEWNIHVLKNKVSGGEQ